MKKNLTILLENGKVFTNTEDAVCNRPNVKVIMTGHGILCWVYKN